MATELKYPIGIQSFESLRENGFAYVDKTALIHKLVTTSRYVFLSRPRRFGKSLLISTIEAYFRGQKQLFEGLAIAELEKDWLEYPIFHFDFNTGSYGEKEGLATLLSNQLAQYEDIYGSNPASDSLQDRFAWLLKKAYEKTGRQCVVLIDEYDKAILSTEQKEMDEHFRKMLKPFYGNLKSQDRYIRFAMLTGVTRFAKLSIFSDLNNLEDISLDDEYASLCGITEEEILSNFEQPVKDFAAKEGLTLEEMMTKLRHKYDGYRFSSANTLVYNPFSLLNSLKKQSLDDFWFETGTPTYLANLLQQKDYELSELEGEVVAKSMLLNVESDSPVPVLYQSGYLTIKDYQKESRLYTLGFPNSEVKSAFLFFLLPYYSNIKKSRTAVEIDCLMRDIREGRVDDFMTRIAGIFAGVAYGTGNSAKMQEDQFRNLFYLLFKLLGEYVTTEQHISNGRIDAVLYTRKNIYIFEFKIDQSAEIALQQIRDKGYAMPFLGDGREIVIIGVNYSTEKRIIDDWKMESLN